MSGSLHRRNDRVTRNSGFALVHAAADLPTVTAPHVIRRARLTCARHALSADDLRFLLDILDLHPSPTRGDSDEI